MTAVDDFLEAIGSQRAERLLRNLDGTIRFDLRRDGEIESVLVTIDDGGVSASRRRRRADCVATMDEALFRSIARGDANAFAAALRGEIEIEGNAALVL